LIAEGLVQSSLYCLRSKGSTSSSLIPATCLRTWVIGRLRRPDKHARSAGGKPEPVHEGAAKLLIGLAAHYFLALASRKRDLLSACESSAAIQSTKARTARRSWLARGNTR